MKKSILLAVCIFMNFEAIASSDTLNLKQEAVQDVINLNNEQAYAGYLQCYALDELKKPICIKSLSAQYVPKIQAENTDYIREFTYEAEKQGFVQFLNQHDKDCDKINEGSLYLKEKEAYEVKCLNAKNFYMRFDYQNQQWSIVE